MKKATLQEGCYSDIMDDSKSLQKVIGKQKTGIMGGTFNPVHIGHLLLAEAALSVEKLDNIMFIPSGQSYMKHQNTIQPADLRLQMVKLAIADNPHFFVSDMEIRRSGNTYTCDTMAQLKREQPQTDFFFLMGADCLFSLETWKNPDKIFASCTILAAVRNGADTTLMQRKCDYFADTYHADIRLLPFSETAISSTDIRQYIKEGRSIRYMVPEAVRLFIQDNKLYK